jgi:hypothetical protein
MEQQRFVQRSAVLLGQRGFTPKNTIACLGRCRDELTQSLSVQVLKTWGEAFNFSSLAGMLFLGKTGFSAAQNHAPDEGVVPHYLYIAMPHIAIGASGDMGLCQRRGQGQASTACGALVAFRSELQQGRVDLELDPDDVEQSLLKQKLFRKLRYGQLPELVDLTRLTLEVIQEDLERLITLTVDPDACDYAVLTGIQIHSPDDLDYVWPATCYSVVSGQRQELQP